jgi:predicted methyltransferase
LLSADDGVDSVYPDLALQGDRAALTWFDSRDGNREVYLYAGPVSELDRPIDGHAVRVTQTPGASIGAYVSWNAGRIGLAWCDNSGGHQRVFIQSFDQNGSALRPAVPLTDGRLEGLIPSIIPWRNGFAVGWNERLAAPGLHGHASTISSFAALRLLPAGTAPMPVPQSITQAVANPDRPAADRERDTRDRPVEVLAFLGLRPGMRVFDLNAATGYYTEILARAVGPAGHVIAHNHPGATAMLGEAALTQRYKQQRLPNVELLTARHAELRLEPGSLDMVLMSMVYHDTYWQEPGVDWGPIDQQALLREFFAALRPGGIVGVIDHVADAGTDPRTVAHALHRIDPEVVKRDFARAGFVLEAESNALRRAGDDHRLGVFDPAIVGRTDRFVMRFRRP